MHLHCPKCSTAYRVDDRLITGTNPTFRCSRCRHVFVVETRSATREEEQAEAVLDTASSGQVVESPPQSRKVRKRTRSARRQEVERKEPAVERTDALGSEATDTSGPRPARDHDDDAGEVRKAPHAREHGFDPGEDFFIFPKEDTDGEAKKIRSGGQLSVLPFVSLFAILLFVFSLVTMTYQVDPVPLESVVRGIPWYGSAVFESSHFQNRLELESLASSFQNVLGEQSVVIISGKVLNRNPDTVANVRLEAQIYDAEGNPLATETVYLGNALSTKTIQDMTTREIALLQSLKPQNLYRIEPNRAVPFTIVLPKPDKGVATFSCRVVSAESTA